jgi:ribosomal protein S18 acetylase RimI-like enzyme
VRLGARRGLARCSISFLRYLSRGRSVAICWPGMKLGRSGPCSCGSAIHCGQETGRKGVRDISEVKIRGAILGDDQALAALGHRAWSSESAVTGRPPADRGFFSAEDTPDQFLVAVSPLRGSAASQIAGYIRLVKRTPLLSNAHVREIQGLAVDPALRSRGIGRALIDAACERASSQGARRVTLRVLSSNASARRLYASAGFTVEGVLPGEFHIAGRYVDDILMGRPLT